jgi:hypothetical protein
MFSTKIPAARLMRVRSSWEKDVAFDYELSNKVKNDKGKKKHAEGDNITSLLCNCS